MEPTDPEGFVASLIDLFQLRPDPTAPLPGFCGARERSGFWLNAVAATLTAISVFLLVRYS